MYKYGKDVPFETLKGQILTSIEEDDDGGLLFTTTEGLKYQMVHHQDCCESVSIEDVVGDFRDLLNTPILMAEDVSSDDSLIPETFDKSSYGGDYGDTYTWTFYKLATINGSVTIRWFGSSNGYYSESVSFEDITVRN